MAVSAGEWRHRVRRAVRAWLRWDRHGLLAVLAGVGAHAGVLVFCAYTGSLLY
jgi:hypothetical protein